MSNSDPSFHRQAEQRFIEHVDRLLDDDRMTIDTLKGRVSVSPSPRKFLASVREDDRAPELKRTMIEMGKADRDLQERMPKGKTIELELKQRRFLRFPKLIGRLRAVCVSPTRVLLDGGRVTPLSKGAVEEIVQRFAANNEAAPTTLVVLSTAGLTADAKSIIESSSGRIVLVEPNDAGGFSIYAPKSIDAELFDPEADNDKRERIREALEEGRMELSGSGVAADKIAAKTQLPAQLVEAELRSYAKENPGLAAKRLDGRMVLFREGSAVQTTAAGGVSAMPMIDKIRALFARRGETEKKIAFLSERRAALGQQRDRAYEEIGTLESRDTGLREEFAKAAAELAKRRITSQLLQLRKDMERRQQLLGVLNQQMNVVSTHLHNLELVQQGQTAKLPDSEEMASDAAAAEEMLATLQESSEMAESVGGVASSGMSAEEQALYEELLRDTGAPAAVVKEPAKGSSIAGATQTPAGQRIVPPIMPAPEREKERKRSEPEAG
jgi:hypothetical protein